MKTVKEIREMFVDTSKTMPNINNMISIINCI
jgi:hypothetical protein